MSDDDDDVADYDDEENINNDNDDDNNTDNDNTTNNCHSLPGPSSMITIITPDDSLVYHRLNVLTICLNYLDTQDNIPKG